MAGVWFVWLRWSVLFAWFDELAPQVSRDIQADGVLFGKVVNIPLQKAFWGSKERYPKRLYLHLVSAEGTLLWKAELPFSVVKGTREVDEEIVKRILLIHVRIHAKELGGPKWDW